MRFLSIIAVSAIANVVQAATTASASDMQNMQRDMQRDGFALVGQAHSIEASKSQPSRLRVTLAERTEANLLVECLDGCRRVKFGVLDPSGQTVIPPYEDRAATYAFIDSIKGGEYTAVVQAIGCPDARCRVSIVAMARRIAVQPPPPVVGTAPSGGIAGSNTQQPPSGATSRAPSGITIQFFDPATGAIQPPRGFAKALLGNCVRREEAPAEPWRADTPIPLHGSGSVNGPVCVVFQPSATSALGETCLMMPPGETSMKLPIGTDKAAACGGVAASPTRPAPQPTFARSNKWHFEAGDLAHDLRDQSTADECERRCAERQDCKYFEFYVLNPKLPEDRSDPDKRPKCSLGSARVTLVPGTAGAQGTVLGTRN